MASEIHLPLIDGGQVVVPTVDGIVTPCKMFEGHLNIAGHYQHWTATEVLSYLRGTLTNVRQDFEKPLLDAYKREKVRTKMDAAQSDKIREQIAAVPYLCDDGKKAVLSLVESLCAALGQPLIPTLSVKPRVMFLSGRTYRLLNPGFAGQTHVRYMLCDLHGDSTEYGLYCIGSNGRWCDPGNKDFMQRVLDKDFELVEDRT